MLPTSADISGNYYEQTTDVVDVSALLNAIRRQVSSIEQIREHIEMTTSTAPGQDGSVSIDKWQTYTPVHDTRKKQRMTQARQSRMQARQSSTQARQSESSYMFRIPLWAVTKVWQISIAQSRGSWTATLRTHNIRKCDSLVFRLAAVGNVRGVRELIERGEASYWDCTLSPGVPGNGHDQKEKSLLEVSLVQRGGGRADKP